MQSKALSLPFGRLTNTLKKEVIQIAKYCDCEEHSEDDIEDNFCNFCNKQIYDITEKGEQYG